MSTYVGTSGPDNPGTNTTDDTLYGLDGNDTLYFGTTFIVYAYGGDGYDLLDQIDNEAGYCHAYGEEGNDRMDGGDYFDELYGGSGSDYITGWDDNDDLEGGSGSDGLFGENGADVLYGGDGDDSKTVSFDVGPSYVTVTGGLSGGAGDDFLDGGRGNDTLDGNADADTLLGGEGNDILDGGSGIDRMSGGSGDDRFYVDDAKDTVTEAAGDGSDYVLTSVNYGLKAGIEVERLSTTSTGGSTAINLTGNDFGQAIYGNGAGNKLVALGGNDTVYGYGGNDALYGGVGKDVLSGGLGNDQFQFDTALNASTNVDTITDFHNVSGDNDTIRLENAVFTKLTAAGALNAANFAANATGTAADANDYVAYETDTGKLFYDADGSGAGKAVQFATVTGHPALTAADFLVV